MAEEWKKEPVARVICDKCRKLKWHLYRSVNNPLNYFLVCIKCGTAHVFRVFLESKIEAKLTPDKGEVAKFEKVLEDATNLPEHENV